MKMYRKKYYFITGLAIFILLISISGCSRSGSTQNMQGREEASIEWEDDEKVTLDWYVNYSWFTTKWGNDLVSRKITQDTGVDINFISPLGNETEKFNALISSDTLPDIITLGWWESQVDIMIINDMVYALNELADQYDPYFFEVADPLVCEWYTHEDGNLYCYPNSTYVPKDYEIYDNIGSNQTFLVRKDIYEAIGKPDMSTPDGFKEAIIKASEMFQAIDGEPIIPIGSHVFNEHGCVSFDQYLQNFLAVPYEKDGLFYDRYTDPDYIRWLKMFRELGEEGYLLDDIFIDNRIQMEEKLAKGRYFCMIYQRTDMEDQQKILYANNPNSIYMAVDGPKNSNGDDHVLPGAGINGWTVTFISKNCKHPDRAIRLFSYLMSEYGQKLTYLGIEGVTYDIVNEKPVVKEEVRELLNTDRQQYNNLYGADNTYWMFQDLPMQMQWKQEYEGPTKQLEEWTYPYTHYLGQYEVDFDVNSQAGNIDFNIKKLWGNVLPKLLLAPSEEEFDKIYQDFIDKRQALGFDIYIKESTKYMNEAKKKVGID
ncbi:MAG: extracellular solute-binding protein [Clostridiales bacterium]|nr:extracellular solute-binding protein [Clostridiales bacterium]